MTSRAQERSDVLQEENGEFALRPLPMPAAISLSDLAASGGYYVAAPAHAIVAQPGTLTGSIGAFGGKFVLGGALDRLGVNLEAVSDGARADLFSPATPFSDGGREALQRQLDATYERWEVEPERLSERVRELRRPDVLYGWDAGVSVVGHAVTSRT